MHKRSSKRLAGDINQIAANIVASATGQDNVAAATQKPKNPAAVALGRLGGMKGGKARAAALSSTRKAQIARRAAAVRWKKHQ